jgi:hypothetical protein
VRYAPCPAQKLLVVCAEYLPVGDIVEHAAEDLAGHHPGEDVLDGRRLAGREPRDQLVAAGHA